MNEYQPIGINTAISLLSEVFGINYMIPQDANQSNEIGTFNATVLSSEPTKRISQFGTPVFGNFSIVPGDVPYMYYDNKGKLSKKQISEFEFPLATIVDFSRDMTITKTPTIGSLGTVKEIMAHDDWKINIRGICLYDESRQAEKTAIEQQNRLIELASLADSLKIGTCQMFSDKGIDRICIESISFTPVQGKPDMIPYEIQAISDISFMLSMPD